MFEVGGFSSKTLTVFGIFLISTAPEIRGVGNVGVAAVDGRQGVFCGAEDKRSTTSTGSIFEGVARSALGDVHTNGHGVVGHARTDEANSGYHGFCASLAGKLPVGGLYVGHRADGFGHDGGGGFDGVGMGF